MKKYTKIAYIVLILIIFICGFCIYKVSAKNNSEEEIKEKILEKINYLENKFIDLFNAVNNIKFENYTISATNIEEQNNKKQSTSGSKSNSGSQEAQSDGQSQESGENQESKANAESEQKENNQQNQSSVEQEKTKNQQYKLKEDGILTQENPINWNEIKNDVEKNYTMLYSTTMDLYKIVENKEEIANFNKEYDNLINAVKNENKEETLNELSKLYDFLPKFVESCSDQENDVSVIKTKKYIFKAYSILDNEDWQTVSQYINEALREISKISTNISDNEKKHKYNINKSYIIISELQNAVSLKDKEVFLIKYKNLLEELENI